MPLPIGQRAPDFDVASSSGRRLRLADFEGKKVVVLYFYPGDFTYGCTRETCGFRDAYAELADQDTEVVGVSVDSDESHLKFSKEYDLPFELVSDRDLTLTRRYDAAGLLSRLTGRSGRVTYVIDKQGNIAGVFDSEIRMSAHVDGVRALVKKLAGQ